MERLASLARAQLRQLTTLWPVLTMHLAMGVTFLCLALLFAACTGRYGGVTWILVWPAYSLVVVGSGYLWLGPRVLGKQADGTLSWKTALSLMPYLGVAELLWFIVRVRGGEDPWHEVAEGLYLGRRLRRWELPARIGLLLDMTAELVELPELRVGRKYVCVPVLDASVPSAHALADAIEAIAAYRGNIYVHCAAGHGRSAMAMAVLLVVRGVARDVDHAVAIMRAVRPRVRLRTTQLRVAWDTVRVLESRALISRG